MNTVYTMSPGAWVWASQSYRGDEKVPVVLGPLYLATGRQYVYWEERVKGEKGWEWQASRWEYIAARRAFRTVRDAAHTFLSVKRWLRLGRTKFRLCRFDGTPLLVVQGSRMWRWDAF